MAWAKLSFQQIKFDSVFAAFALALVSCANGSFVVQAQSKPESSSVRFVKPTVVRRGAPPSGRQTGSASRGECSAVSQPLTALVPTTQETFRQTNEGDDPELNRWESVLGLTTSLTPSLWFYNPYLAKPVKFVLQDERGNYIYESYFATDQTQPGIVKLSLPKAISLKVGQKYQWYFLVSCDPKNTAFVKGWIQPVALSSALTNQLKKANPQQRVALYAANGIWYDALALLASLRSANPKDAKLLNDWVSLLNSVGLDAIAQKPINKSEIVPTPTVSRMSKDFKENEHQH